MTEEVEGILRTLEKKEQEMEKLLLEMRRKITELESNQDSHWIEKICSQIDSTIERFTKAYQSAKKKLGLLSVCVEEFPDYSPKHNDHKNNITKLKQNFEQISEQYNKRKSEVTTLDSSNSSGNTSAGGSASGQISNSSSKNDYQQSSASNNLPSSAAGSINDANSQALKKKKKAVGEVKEIKLSSEEIGSYGSNANSMLLSEVNPELNAQVEKELFAEIFETQKESIDILARMNQQAEETIDTAKESATLLVKQREQLIEIDKKLDEMGSLLKVGLIQLRFFSRKIARSKMILLAAVCCCCCFLLIMIFIFAMLFLAMGNQSLKKVVGFDIAAKIWETYLWIVQQIKPDEPKKTILWNV